MSDHKFPVAVAKDFDVETALLLEFMRFITLYNKSNKRHLHDGSVWVYNSYEAWTEQFPYWTAKQMRRILGNAEENGLLLVGNYNKRAADLTKWYALSDKAIEYFPELKEQINNTPAQTGKPPAQTGKPPAQMGKTPAQTGSALPDTNTDTNTDKTTTTCSSSFTPFETKCLEFKHSTDDRTPDEFLENVHHHVKLNSDPDSSEYQRQQMILKLLRNLHQNAAIFKSKGYVSKETIKETEKQTQEQKDKLLWSAYQGYVNSPIEKDLRARGIAKLESFEEWKQKACIV